MPLLTVFNYIVALREYRTSTIVGGLSTFTFVSMEVLGSKVFRHILDLTTKIRI